MSLHAGKMGARCHFALRSAGTTSPALNPSSARDERVSEVAFPLVHGVVEAEDCPSPSLVTWGSIPP